MCFGYSFDFSLNYLDQMLVQDFLLAFCISFYCFCNDLVVVFDKPVACLHDLKLEQMLFGHIKTQTKCMSSFPMVYNM